MNNNTVDLQLKYTTVTLVTYEDKSSVKASAEPQTVNTCPANSTNASLYFVRKVNYIMTLFTSQFYQRTDVSPFCLISL